ncbi:MAG: hypothetical protein WC848_02855 [Parcubacteria group bacterium]|jgi:hypothetical protein
MKKSKQIIIGSALTALILSGCSDGTSTQRRCVDKDGKILADSDCAHEEEMRRRGYGGYPGNWMLFNSHYPSGPYVAPSAPSHNWAWGGAVSKNPGGTTILKGGSSSMPKSSGFSSSFRGGSSSGTSVSRGGFGGSASAHSGGFGG